MYGDKKRGVINLGIDENYSCENVLYLDWERINNFFLNSCFSFIGVYNLSLLLNSISKISPAEIRALNKTLESSTTSMDLFEGIITYIPDLILSEKKSASLGVNLLSETASFAISNLSLLFSYSNISDRNILNFSVNSLGISNLNVIFPILFRIAIGLNNFCRLNIEEVYYV